MWPALTRTGCCLFAKEAASLTVLSLCTQYARGQLYMIAKASKEETIGDEGVEVVENVDYEDEKGKGIYTFKKIHLTQKLPGWLRRLFPFVGDVLTIEEKSWNSYPYCRTEYRSHLFGEKCRITVLSRHVENDRGDSPNVFKLDKEALEARKVEFLDIADSSRIDSKSYNESEDPSLFKSTKTQPARGPFRPGRWHKTTTPITCAYKLVTVEFAYKALRTRIESYIHDIIAPIYLKTHRQAVCWMDEWINLTSQQIRQVDAEAAAHLMRSPGSKASAAPAEPKPSEAPSPPAPPNKSESNLNSDSEAKKQPSESAEKKPLPRGSFLKLRERLHLRSKL